MCLTIQRGVFGNVADTQIGKDNRPPPDGLADVNYGSSNVFNSGDVGVLPRLALVRFDLAGIGIPAIASITSATVTLNARTSGSSAIVDVHRITAPWDEHTVTYASFGLAYDPTVETSFSNGGLGYAGPLTFDVQGLVQGWVSTTVANDGLLLDQGSSQYTNYWSSEWTSIPLRPKLDLCYVIPG